MNSVLVIRRAKTGSRPFPSSKSALKTSPIAPFRRPSWAPSKVVPAIVIRITATEPGTRPHPVAPDSQGRRRSRPSRTSSGERRANIPK